MRTSIKYAAAFVLLPLFIVSATAWLAWRILGLLWRVIVAIPAVLAWAFRTLVLAALLVVLAYLIATVASKL